MSAEATQKQRGRGRPRSNTQKSEKSTNSQHLGWNTTLKPKEMDPCDCPYPDCEGCWYPCDTCGSTKCSPFCRRIRSSMEMHQAPIEWKHSL